MWRTAQVKKLPIMQFSPVTYYFSPLASKYSPQNPVFKRPQSVFFSSYQRPSSIPVQNHRQNYGRVYCNIYVVRQQTRSQKVLNWMVASIT
jgi:hypothetical protein